MRAFVDCASRYADEYRVSYMRKAYFEAHFMRQCIVRVHLYKRMCMTMQAVTANVIICM